MPLVQLLLLAVLMPGAVVAMPPRGMPVPASLGEFTLPNGLHFIVLERHEMPMVACRLYVNSGSADEPEGKRGLARMFERLVLHGTARIGTRRWEMEKKALAEMEQAYDRLEAARAAGQNQSGIGPLEAAWKLSRRLAAGQAAAGHFQLLLEAAGVSGWRAEVSQDATSFAATLPSNRAEAWFELMGDWLAQPVFRGFYDEREYYASLKEEPQRGAPAPPLRAVLEGLPAGHPYRSALPEERNYASLRTADAEAFFRKHYTAANMVIVVVGDVTLANARRWAEHHFQGVLPGAVKSDSADSADAPSTPRKLDVPGGQAPFAAIAFRRPPLSHPDAPALELLAALLGQGQAGILAGTLVTDRRWAIEIVVDPAWPGEKYSTHLLVRVTPAPGPPLALLEAAILKVLDDVRANPAGERELREAKARAITARLRALNDPAGAAWSLASAHFRLGGARQAYAYLERLEAVTAADLKRVAEMVLRPENRTIVWYQTSAPPAAQGGRPGEK